MKNRIIAVSAWILVAVCFALFLTGCGKDAQEADPLDAYYGEFRSTFVDGQNEDDENSFKLTISPDHTFQLTKYVKDVGTVLSGTWKSSTRDGSADLLCLVESDFSWPREAGSTSYHPYFSLTVLDDGTLAASPAVVPIGNTTFSTTETNYISLIIFEKKS